MNQLKYQVVLNYCGQIPLLKFWYHYLNAVSQFTAIQEIFVYVHLINLFQHFSVICLCRTYNRT